LRSEKLASPASRVNSVLLKRSLEAGFFVALVTCEDVYKPLKVFTPFRLLEALVSGP